MTPKPRGEGQRGGMNHTGSQSRSARRGGDPGKYGGPPNKGPVCPLVLLFLIAVPSIIITATGGLIFG